MQMRLGWLAAATALGLAVFAGAALAQRSFDDERYQRRSDDRERNVAGEFDYYALVMSWSPTYCSEKQSDGYDPQCDRRDGRRYAFVLHGLWPQYERGYPERCFTRKKPYVPQTIIDSMLDIMPSPRLVIHEFKKHGTCSGLDPAGYYEVSRRLFKSIRIPERYVNPQEAMFVSRAELEDDLIEENPGLKPDMLSVVCGGAGSRLREVRICFGKDGALRSCGSNEDQRRLCSTERMYLPPVRSSRTEPDTADERERDRPVETPRPRVIESLRGR
ncbi:MAG: ribonuclease T2 family protein [Hyphomicrobium sp.]